MKTRLFFLGSIVIRSVIVLVIAFGSTLSAAAPPTAKTPEQAKSNQITATSSTPNTPNVAEVSRPTESSEVLSTFARDESLGDGTRRLTISADPLYYQAEDGSWLPINPRFIAAEGGFTNFTNALRLSTGERVAVINLANGNNRLQWQPQELAFVGDNGTQVRLASVLDPSAAIAGELVQDDQTVQYSQSWSDSRLIEQVTAKPGSVEQKLIINSPFDSTFSNVIAGEDTSLSLLATLRLEPGMSLHANGVSQLGNFTTSGSVEIRADGKTVLVLDPVLAYERDDPSVSTSGSYRFRPTGEGLWQVKAQAPWEWLAATGRQYPVVLDPTMKILAPVTTAQICDNYPYSTCPQTDTNFLMIGHGTTYGIIEALMRFDNLPTLPPGYVIQKADLLIAPEQVLLSNGGSYQSKQTRLVQITSAWDPATVNYNSNRPSTAPTPLDTEYLHFGIKPAIPISATTFVTRFHIQSGPTGLVSDWLSGAQANNGLLFYQYPANNCLGCSDMLKIYTTPLWSKDDPRRLDPENPFVISASEGSGFMLQIIYAPPTLQLGQSIYTSLPTFGKTYADTYHTYLPPSSSSTWTAVAVKGLQQVQLPEGTIDKAAGNLRMAAGCEDKFAPSCVVKPSEGDFKKRPNFVLTRGDPAATDLAAWVYPPNTATPANANLDEYEVEAIPSADLPGNPTLSPGTHITETVVMSTSEIMQLYNLNLVANTRLGVQVHAWTIDPATGYDYPMPYLEARLYKPAVTGSKLVKDIDGMYIGGYSDISTFEMGKAKVGTSEGGTWALSLEYFGDVDPSVGEPPITYTMPLSMSVEMVFVTCPSNGIPTEYGCFSVNKPGVTTQYMDVGNFRVYNEAGFVCNGTLCHTKFQPGPGATVPSVVWRADWLSGPQNRWIAVANDDISFDTSTCNMVPLTCSFWTAGNSWLATDVSGSVEMTEMFTGATVGWANVNNIADPNYARLTPLGTTVYASPPLSASDAANLHINLNVKEQRAEAAAAIERQILVGPGSLNTFAFNLSWIVRAEGYTAMTNKNLSVVHIAPQAELASMTVIFGSAWDMDYTNVYMPNGRFTNLRGLAGYNGDGGVGARISAPASMGSNWKGVTTLLLPIGENLPDSDASCTGDCLDVRAFSDTPSAPNRTWDLPDLNISDQAQTLFFNKPGELTVFSTDHPNSVDAVSLPFSFRTFEGEVNVDVKVCPNSGSPDKVAVITGKSKIALPGLGSDTNPGTMIGAEFILCETTLRDVSLEFQGPPDIPVGSTPVLVDYVKGGVLIGPSNTQIKITVNYHDNSDVVDGTAEVTINTDGLFDLQTSGEVLAKVDYKGHAWVAWNPLDVGVDVHAWYSSWLDGDVDAHMWKGQGWQNKYSWLPPDNATHFAGSIEASIGIDKGQAFSWEFIDIPPWDISFSITVAFGQFCKGTGCSSNEWGIKGKFEVIGFNVGFFYGFKSGFHFILGSDGHVLIDQYNSNQTTKTEAGEVRNTPMSAGKPLALTRQAVANPLAPEVTQPLNVTAFTGSFVAGLTWSQGAPLLTLIRPDNVEITPANAPSFGISVISGATFIQYGVPDPVQGQWQAKISNTAADNDYHFVWFANKEVPNLVSLTPSGTVNMPANNASYNIQWGVPAALPAEVDLRLSLFYTVTNSTAITSTETAGGVIRENLPLTPGSYNWDLSSLAKGDYHVYARVYSGQAGNEPILPEPTITGTNQIPGDAWFYAPGVIHLLDAVPPAVPTGFGLVPISNGFLGCWTHNAEKDLSGYVIRYSSPDVFGVDRGHALRVSAEVSDPNSWMQCARLGGFNDGELITAQIAAYDASGNLSAFTDLIDGVVSYGAPDGPPRPEDLSVVVVATNQVEISWAPSRVPPGAWLSMSRGRPLGVSRTEPPLDMGHTDHYTLSTLAPGWVYFFQVQNYDDMARLSLPSESVAALVSNFVDSDGDGLPDDWEAANNVSDPARDEDGDGLENQLEFFIMTNPQYRDTDGDGFSDGTETVGSDPLDPNSTPALLENYESGVLPLPELSVNPLHLTYRAFTLGPNPAPQIVSVLNLGGGRLNPIITDEAAWLGMSLNGTELNVSVNKDSLQAGHYTATINISGTPGDLTQNSPQAVKVDLWLFQGNPPPLKTYLPMVEK